MEWTKTKKLIVGVIVALPCIILTWLLVLVLKGPNPAAPEAVEDSGPANFTPVPDSGKAKAIDPIPLNAFYLESSAGFSAGGSSGWPGLPRDAQIFSNVRFQVDGSVILGGGTGYVASYHYPTSEMGIPVKQTFASLYVLHFTEWSDPPGTPVYDLVLHYADGTAVTNELQYGTDLLDFYAPDQDQAQPTGPNSAVAWRGHFVMNNGTDQALRIFVTELKNPKPAEEVASLDLISCKNKSAGCILALTTGKSGLVRKLK